MPRLLPGNILLREEKRGERWEGEIEGRESREKER
jgi:hypothetical protein